MVAWTLGLFSSLGEDNFFPEDPDFFLSPLALAGPNVCTFPALPWLLDLSFDSPETWMDKDHVQGTKLKRRDMTTVFMVMNML